MTTGTYIGFTTVGIFVYWYCYYDWSEYGHQLITVNQLRNWSECPHWENFTVKPFLHYDFKDDPCEYFDWGKQKASTMSLTTLVMIEMFNAINALSDEKSLLQTGIFLNPLLIAACVMSTGLHLVILYVPFMANIFGTTALSRNDWLLTLGLSAPVILIDEVVKVFVRARTQRRLERIRKKLE
jgi:Ca2+-transporting ATPase